MVTRVFFVSFMALLAGCGSENFDERDINENANPTQDTFAPTNLEQSDQIGLSLTNSDCYKGDTFVCAAEKEITRLTNSKRSGRTALINNIKTGFVSRDWSQKQSTQGLSHSGFPTARETVYKNEFGQSISFLAENVAYFTGCGNMTAQQIAAKFVDMWWNSSGHRQNMLGNYKNLGSGVHRTSTGACYATQLFSN